MSTAEVEFYPKINTLFKRDPKTNRIRLGDYTTPEFAYLAGNSWEGAEKIDGMSTIVRYDPASEAVTFHGRTAETQMPPRLLAWFDANIDVDLFRSVFKGQEGSEPVHVYGEGFGGKIQNGGRYSPTERFAVFDIRIGRYWLRRSAVTDLCETLDLEVAPLLGHDTLEQWVNRVAAGESMMSVWNSNLRVEGVVLRPNAGGALFNHKGERIVTKVKFGDFRHILPVVDLS
jgi:hypothetical protein